MRQGSHRPAWRGDGRCAGCADATSLAPEAKNHPDVAVRGGAVVALRRLKSPAIAAFLKDTDIGIVLETARAIYDVPIPRRCPHSPRCAVKRRLTDRNILLRTINANYRLGAPANAKALAALAADNNANEFGRKEALTVLAAWANPAPKDRLLYLCVRCRVGPPMPPPAALAPAMPAILSTVRAPSRKPPRSPLQSSASMARPTALLAIREKCAFWKGIRIESLRALASMKDRARAGRQGRHHGSRSQSPCRGAQGARFLRPDRRAEIDRGSAFVEFPSH